MSQERRDAYVALRTTAEECTDIADENLVQRDWGAWLYDADSDDEEGEPAPASILAAWEEQDACLARLDSARGRIDQLTDDEDIRTAASDLAQAASVPQGVKLERLRLLAQAEHADPPEDEHLRSLARDSLTTSQTAYEDAATAFAEETRPRTSRGWIGWLGVVALILGSVALLVLIVWHVASWLRRPRRPKETPASSAEGSRRPRPRSRAAAARAPHGNRDTRRRLTQRLALGIP